MKTVLHFRQLSLPKVSSPRIASSATRALNAAFHLGSVPFSDLTDRDDSGEVFIAQGQVQQQIHVAAHTQALERFKALRASAGACSRRFSRHAAGHPPQVTDVDRAACSRS